MTRTQSDPPKWMSSLQPEQPRVVFALGFLQFAVGPTDIVTAIRGRLTYWQFVTAWPAITMSVAQSGRARQLVACVRTTETVWLRMKSTAASRGATSVIAS